MVRPLPFRKNDVFEQKRSYDKLHHAQTTIDAAHRAIHEGFMFYVEKFRNPLPAGTTDLTLLQTFNKAPHLQSYRWSLDFDKQVLDGPNSTEPPGAIIIRLFEDAIVSDLGDPRTSINRNRVINIETVPTMLMYDSPTVTDFGTQITTVVLPTTSIEEDLNDASTNEWILKPNTNYVTSIENTSAFPAVLLARLTWYELDFDPPTDNGFNTTT